MKAFIYCVLSAIVLFTVSCKNNTVDTFNLAVLKIEEKQNNGAVYEKDIISILGIPNYKDINKDGNVEYEYLNKSERIVLHFRGGKLVLLETSKNLTTVIVH